MRDSLSDPITTAEAALILKCVPDNVRRLAREGRLRPVAIVGHGQRLFARSSVEELARERAAKSVPSGEAA